MSLNDIESIVKLLKVHPEPRSVVDYLKENENFEKLFTNLATNTSADIIDYAILRGGRWREGEQWIMRHDDLRAGLLYTRDVIKGRWPELENLLLSTVKGDRANRSVFDGVTVSVDYAIDVIKDRWDDFEEAVIASYSIQSYEKYFSPLIYYHSHFFDGDEWNELTDIMRDRMILHKSSGFRSGAAEDIFAIETYLNGISMNVDEFVSAIPRVHQKDIKAELWEQGMR